MITVTYHPKLYSISIDGHARSGEPGHDLVCAAVSTLVYTLAANVQDLAANKSVRDVSVELESGKAHIQCKPATRVKAVVEIVYNAVCVGFALLAKNYPKNVRYEVLDT